MKAGHYAFTEDTSLTEPSPRNPHLLSFEVTHLSGQIWWPTFSSFDVHNCQRPRTLEKETSPKKFQHFHNMAG